MDRMHAITVHRDGSQLPGLRSEAAIVAVTPAADIVESEREYVIRIDLPGSTRDSIRVEVVPGTLTVTADVVPNREDVGWVIHREILSNRFARSFNLGHGVKEPDIVAEAADGVLTIHVPKTEEARTRQIPVR